MSKETLKAMIELVPEKEFDTLFKVIVKFIPEVEPEPDEIQAIVDGRKDIEENGTISHEDIDWDAD